jgi:hypothetical protein
LLTGLLEVALSKDVGPRAGFLEAGLPKAGVGGGWVGVIVRAGRHCVCVDQDFKVYLIKHFVDNAESDISIFSMKEENVTAVSRSPVAYW